MVDKACNVSFLRGIHHNLFTDLKELQDYVSEKFMKEAKYIYACEYICITEAIYSLTTHVAVLAFKSVACLP